MGSSLALGATMGDKGPTYKKKDGVIESSKLGWTDLVLDRLAD